MIETIAKLTRKFHPRGTERLLRLLNNPDNPNRKIIKTVLDYYHGLKLNIDTSYFIEWFIFFKGLYEEKYLKRISPFIEKGGIFLDVGANFGCYALIFSQTAEKVYAFEPNPSIYKRLRENIVLNNIDNVITEPLCLSDESSESVNLYTNIKMNETGTASLLPLNKNTEIIKCKATTIDEYFEDKNRLDFIKIDVDGGEDKVLKGAQKTLKRLKPVILFESTKKDELLFNLLPNYKIETLFGDLEAGEFLAILNQ